MLYIEEISINDVDKEVCIYVRKYDFEMQRKLKELFSDTYEVFFEEVI